MPFHYSFFIEWHVEKNVQKIHRWSKHFIKVTFTNATYIFAFTISKVSADVNGFINDLLVRMNERLAYPYKEWSLFLKFIKIEKIFHCKLISSYKRKIILDSLLAKHFLKFDIPHLINL